MKTQETLEASSDTGTIIPAFLHLISRPVWAVVTVAAASFVIFGYSIWYPLGRDQAIFAYIADRISEGGLPYRDAWDFKSPGIYYIYFLAFTVFGRAEISIRILDFIAALGTAWLIWHIFYRRGMGAVGTAAGVIYGILYGLSGYWSMAQTEGFGTFFITLAAHRILSDNWKRLVNLLFAGLALGAAVLMKYPFLLVFFGFMVFAVFEEKAGRFGTALLLTAGMAVIPVITAAFFAAHGTLGDAYTASVWFAGQYQRYPPKALLDIPLDFVIGAMGRKTVYDVLVLPLAVTGALFRVSRLEREQRLGIIWIVSSLASIAVQLKFFPYHWVAMFAPAALLSGAAISAISGQKTSDGRFSRVIVAAVICLLLVRSLLASMTEWGYLMAPSKPGEVSPWLAQFSTSPEHGVSYASDAAAAAYIKENTSPEETVLVFGFEPLINFLSERRSPTRFVYPDAVVAPWSPEGWGEEYLMDLAESKPKFIVVAHDDTHIWRAKESAMVLAQWPKMKSFMNENYMLAGRVGNFEIWGRKQ